MIPIASYTTRCATAFLPSYITLLMKRDNTRSLYCGSGRSCASLAVNRPAIVKSPLAHLSALADSLFTEKPGQANRLLALSNHPFPTRVRTHEQRTLLDHFITS